MKPQIKKKNWIVRLLTGKNITGITLAPFGIYLREDVYDKQNPITINHEKIHWQQQMEMLIIFFYFFYFTEWLIRTFTNWGGTYRSISFEREAYKNDTNYAYLNNRKPFSWIKYLFK